MDSCHSDVEDLTLGKSYTANRMCEVVSYPKRKSNFPLCEDGGIGDEHNYLLQCKFLTPDRKKNLF